MVRNLFITIYYMKTELIVLAFILGFYFCCTYKHNITEGYEQPKYKPSEYENNSDLINKDCPNLLLREGNVLHLINTRAPRIAGINPIVFNNLDEYIDYWEFQRENGIQCPVLYFQETYDAQNRKGYRLLVNPLEPNAGIESVFKQKENKNIKRLLTDANLSKPKFNQNQFSSFDPEDQMIGLETKADKQQHSEDPMSKNWKGHEATHKAILSGKFEGRTRKPDEKPILGSGY